MFLINKVFKYFNLFNVTSDKFTEQLRLKNDIFSKERAYLIG